MATVLEELSALGAMNFVCGQKQTAYRKSSEQQTLCWRIGTQIEALSECDALVAAGPDCAHSLWACRTFAVLRAMSAIVLCLVLLMVIVSAILLLLLMLLLMAAKRRSREGYW